MSNIQLINNMKTLRRKFGYTQEEFASLFNISRQAYSNYETSKREPDIDLIIKLAQHFNLTLDRLILDTLDPYADTIKECKGPYIPASVSPGGDFMYVTRDEIDTLIKYRRLSENDKRFVDRILNLQPEEPEPED